MSRKVNKNKKLKTGSIVIYQPSKKAPEVRVKIERDTVWLSQAQIAELFQTERSVITKHIRNIFKDNELKETSVSAKFAHTASDGKSYQTKFYNLDMIISVGYRTNSKQATLFRIWATNVLRKHIINGYTINKKLLQQQQEKFIELKRTVSLLQQAARSYELTTDEAKGLIDVIKDYAYGLDVLDRYDHQTLTINHTVKKELEPITYSEVMSTLTVLKKMFKSSTLFAREKDKSFHGTLGAIYQTFDGKELYPSVEEKAAHLLYFTIKNHSFVDGNKRIAAFIFIWFLQRYGHLYNIDGSKRIADNALVALCLMIAESKPEEKKLMIKVIINLINKKN